MSNESLDQIREHALIALTYIELDQNENRDQAHKDLTIIQDAYTKDQIQEGGMLVLSMILAGEANAMGITIPERIAQLRELVRENLYATEE